MSNHCPADILKPVGRIFKISNSKPIWEDVENAESPSHGGVPERRGSEELPRSEKAKNAEKAENADTKTRKTRTMRLTGFIVTGCSRVHTKWVMQPHASQKGSLKEVLLRRVLRRPLVRISVGTGVLRRGAIIEGA